MEQSLEELKSRYEIAYEGHNFHSKDFSKMEERIKEAYICEIISKS